MELQVPEIIWIEILQRGSCQIYQATAVIDRNTGIGTSQAK